MGTQPIENALVGIVEAMNYIGVELSPTEPQYDLLQKLINACTTAIDQYLGRPVVAKEFTLKRTGDGSNTLFTPIFPVFSVSRFDVVYDYYRTTIYSLQEDDDFFIEEDSGIITLNPAGKRLFRFPKIPKGITLKYTAGLVQNFASIPADIPLACLILLKFYWQMDIAQFSTTFQESGVVIRPSAWPSQVHALLNKPGYKMPANFGAI